jgi:Icc protein
MLNHIIDAKPHGVFLTGDVSHSGFSFLSDLEFLGKRMKCPLYFVEGNHDYWLSSIDVVRRKIEELTAKYPNLIWMPKANVVSLTEEVAVIGASGFYTAEYGNKDFLKFTLDWMMIRDFRILSSWEERIVKFQQLATEDNNIITRNLELALEHHNTVFLICHYPPWKEADRHSNFLSEKFWEPYNSNTFLGKELERIMAGRKKKHLTVLCGHTHQPMTIHISRNIDCRVSKAGYFRTPDSEMILI